MDLLASGYGSDSDEELNKKDEGKGAPSNTDGRQQQNRDSDDSSAVSSDESTDSAAQRAAAAVARLRDYGETATSGSGRRPDQKPPAKSILPSPLDALDQVDRPPTFLDPEAIRPLASSAMHGLSDEAAALLAGPGPGSGGGRGGGRQAPGKDFDISRLAPPLKGQAKQSADKRDAPPGAVIEGKAKRYKPDEGPEATQQYTAAQIAMMGGNVSEAPGKRPSGPTKPMGVSDFLDKGVGAAQLPRRNQDRKEKEKEKRMRGQSTHSHWKSEAEMVLRQQFDS